jgi:hypothetical protein
VLAWDQEKGEFMKFGSNGTVAREEIEAEASSSSISHFPSAASKTPCTTGSCNGRWLAYVVFDIIYLNCETTERRCEILSSIFTNSDGVFQNSLSEIKRNDCDVAFLRGIDEDISDSALSLSLSTANTEEAIASLNLSPQKGDITGVPLYLRKQILQKVVTVCENRVQFVKCKVISGSESSERRQSAIEDYFFEASTAGEEGLVIKVGAIQFKFN